MVLLTAMKSYEEQRCLTWPDHGLSDLFEHLYVNKWRGFARICSYVTYLAFGIDLRCIPVDRRTCNRHHPVYISRHFDMVRPHMVDLEFSQII